MAAYDPDAIRAFFDDAGSGEWERLVQDPLHEVILHVHDHYLRQHLRAGWRVLEIGSGPGRFTKTLHAIGCRVLVADISPVQLELNREQGRRLGFDACVEDRRELDVCDLGPLASGSFDAVVAYGGPLGYALDRRDRAVAECARVLRGDGLLLASVSSLWGSLHASLPVALRIDAATNRRIIDSGDLTPEILPATRHRLHMYRSGELRDLLEAHGLRVCALSASNCLATAWGTELEEIRKDAERWEQLLALELEACAREGCLDAGMHLLAVARRA